MRFWRTGRFRPETLTELLLEADEKVFPLLFPKLREHHDQVLPRLTRELDRKAEPRWPDKPLEPSWKRPTGALVREIEQADGVVAERFAFCQTLPMERAGPLVAALAESGYRPVCFRPYTHGKGVQGAAAWARDSLDWQLLPDATLAELHKQDAAHQSGSYLPHDVCGWSVGDQDHYAALWLRDMPDVVEARLFAGVLNNEQLAIGQRLKDDGFVPRTRVRFRSGKAFLHNAVWWKPTENAVSSLVHAAAYNEASYESVLKTGRLQVSSGPVLPLAERQGTPRRGSNGVPLRGGQGDQPMFRTWSPVNRGAHFRTGRHVS